jgi:hypothetical protein
MFRIALILALAGALYSAPAESVINQQLPKWIRLGGEIRYREEGFLGSGFTEGQDDMYLLQRYRLSAHVQPKSWLQFFAQGQDARVSFTGRANPAPFRDSADIRQVWVQFGNAEKGLLNLKIGRQDLIFGEERLVGAGNWGNTARSFDAVRLSIKHNGYRVDTFASSVVVPRDHEFDRHRGGDNLHGMYAWVERWIPKASVEPAIFWRVSPRAVGELGGARRLNSFTPGIRINGTLPRGFEYTTEMWAQRGTWATDDMSSWAGLWRFGKLFENARWKPRIRLEVNHASGDSDPRDGKHGTFELLYPTPHDKYGLADQVGWKNLNHIGVIGEVRAHKSLVLQLKGHDRWLASARDGLYNAGGALLVRDPSGRSGTHIGKEVDVQAIWNPSTRVQLSGGIGHMFAGEFLKKTTPGNSYTFPYVMLTYGF